MATTNTKHETTFDDMFDKATEAGDQFAAAARKIGHAYLDSYDKTVDRAIEAELRLAGHSQQEWLKSLIETQAEFTRELTSSYTGTVRSLLK
jgi:DNA-binding ferritin-like protein